MKIYTNIFADIISPDNLFLAWDKFKKGKQNKLDVMAFEWQLEENIFQLRRDLETGCYTHGTYTSFYIQDPKQRHIHKATVRDRVLHHAIFNILNPIFEPTFIANSFSCRIGKGTHKGVIVLEEGLRKESKNYTRPCFALKCDIKKFFDSIDHDILLGILSKRIKDERATQLLRDIVESFRSQHSTINKAKGLPIGNLTSQLFANIYLNTLDQYVKHQLKIKNYVRYTDDFVIISNNNDYLQNVAINLDSFLLNNLKLKLHPNKIIFRKFRQGVDFLGYIVLPHYRLLRNKTKKRIFRKLTYRLSQYQRGIIGRQTFEQSLQSYLGVLSHADTFYLKQAIKNYFTP